MYLYNPDGRSTGIIGQSSGEAEVDMYTETLRAWWGWVASKLDLSMKKAPMLFFSNFDCVEKDNVSTTI